MAPGQTIYAFISVSITCSIPTARRERERKVGDGPAHSLNLYMEMGIQSKYLCCKKTGWGGGGIQSRSFI